MSKRSTRKAKAGRVVRRTLADGTVREYRYGVYKAPVSRVSADSLEALIRAYKRSPTWAALAEGTKVNRAAYLRSLEEIGQMDARAVTRRDIIMIRDAIATQRGNGAGNSFKQAASALFAWAADNDWISQTPVSKVKKLPEGHYPAWTMEQAETALGGLPERLRRVVVLGLYTGQRRGDLCAAKWSNYDGVTLRFIQEKTGAEVLLRVHPDLKAELDEWMKTATAETILVNDWGKPWLPNTMSIVLPRAFRLLNLPAGLNVHGMRKLFAAGMADNGATVHEIKANTGHKTLGMIQLYTSSADQKKLSESAVSKIQTFTTLKKNVDMFCISTTSTRK